MCIRCRGDVFTEPLPSNDKGIHTHTHKLMGRIYEIALEIDSGALIYIPSFIKLRSRIQKLIGGYTNTHTAWRSHTPTWEQNEIISQSKFAKTYIWLEFRRCLFRFSARTWVLLTENFRGFLLSLKANAGIASLIRPRPPPSTTVSLHEP
jgi:hypothetical protein